MGEEQQATPHDDLIGQIMDSRVPKNEREWAAAREIEALRARAEAAEKALAECRATTIEECAAAIESAHVWIGAQDFAADLIRALKTKEPRDG